MIGQLTLALDGLLNGTVPQNSIRASCVCKFNFYLLRQCSFFCLSRLQGFRVASPCGWCECSSLLFYKWSSDFLFLSTAGNIKLPVFIYQKKKTTRIWSWWPVHYVHIADVSLWCTQKLLRWPQTSPLCEPSPGIAVPVCTWHSFLCSLLIGVWIQSC